MSKPLITGHNILLLPLHVRRGVRLSATDVPARHKSRCAGEFERVLGSRPCFTCSWPWGVSCVRLWATVDAVSTNQNSKHRCCRGTVVPHWGHIGSLPSGGIHCTRGIVLSTVTGHWPCSNRAGGASPMERGRNSQIGKARCGKCYNQHACLTDVDGASSVSCNEIQALSHPPSHVSKQGSANYQKRLSMSVLSLPPHNVDQRLCLWFLLESMVRGFVTNECVMLDVC